MPINEPICRHECIEYTIISISTQHEQSTRASREVVPDVLKAPTEASMRHLKVAKSRGEESKEMLYVAWCDIAIANGILVLFYNLTRRVTSGWSG